MKVQVVQSALITYLWTCSGCGKGNEVTSTYYLFHLACRKCGTAVYRKSTQLTNWEVYESPRKEKRNVGNNS